MHINSFICLTVFAGLCYNCHTPSRTTTATSPKTVNAATATPRFTLIIMYDKAKGKKSLMRAIRKWKAQMLYDYKNFNGIAISLPTTCGEQEAIQYFRNVKGVLSVQKDRKMQLLDVQPEP